jgi:hypothetical protein
MNIGHTILKEDISAMRGRQVLLPVRIHRLDETAPQGEFETAIAHALAKFGSMDKKLLFLAVPQHMPCTLGSAIARMLRRGALVIETRGDVDLLRLARAV